MLTRTVFLAKTAQEQESIARRIWANLHETHSSFNPVGGENNDIWMCDTLPGDAIQELDEGRFLLWDTGTRILAVCAASHDPRQQFTNRCYPLAVAITKS